MIKFIKILTALGLFLILIPYSSYAQPKTINVTANFKIEEGSLEKSYLVLENLTTGESQTIQGQSKFSINIKPDNDYILSFNKPGYVTKRIGINTSAPADRIVQGFYPIMMTVILFKQYEGVNIIVFNQPVSKYKYSKIIDDFDYDTDYTKQIQSALKEAEEALAEKKTEEKKNAVVNQDEIKKAKADSIVRAQGEMKAQLEEEKKLKEEASIKKDEEIRIKNDSVVIVKKELAAKADEEKRKEAQAKSDEEERKKGEEKLNAEEKAKAAIAKAEEDARKKAQAKSDADEKIKTAENMKEEERQRKAQEKIDKEEKAKAAALLMKEDARKKAEAKADEDAKKKSLAAVNKDDDSRKVVIEKRGEDIFVKHKPEPGYGSETAMKEKSETLPVEINVEEITEPGRTITKATVMLNAKESVYYKIIYKWGGIYYFKGSMPISMQTFYSFTKLK